MISINATLVAQLIHFLILLFILNRLMLQPILKVIKDREAYSLKTKSEINEIEVKIGQLKEQYVEKERGAIKDAAVQRNGIINHGMNEAEKFLGTSREQVSAIRKKAEKDADDEISKTQPQLRQQAASLVDGITEKIIGRRVKA